MKNPSLWKKGQSGNPRGRPKGVKTGENLRAMLYDRIPAIVEVLVEKALAGDAYSAKILLDRTISPLKATAEAVPFVIADNDSLPDIGQAVLDMLSRGELSPDACSQIIGALATQSKIRESEELAERISALEAKVDG